MSFYVDNDGTLKAFICGACRGSIEITERGEDWTRWSCPCGKATSLHIDGGILDLDNVELDKHAGDFEIFGPPPG